MDVVMNADIKLFSRSTVLNNHVYSGGVDTLHASEGTDITTP